MNSTFWTFPVSAVEALVLFLAAYVVVLGLADVYLIVMHIVRGRREIEIERVAISNPAIAGDQLPFVCIQLPLCNEPSAMAIRTLESLARLDYPDYEVLVIDNNTADPAVWRPVRNCCVSLGRRFRFFHFDELKDFKAGALREALLRTSARYVAVFDADYRPEPSFLREMMTVLLADRHVAFVQARLTYRNRDSNWLTRAQAVEFDTFLAYEQAARHWAGVPTTFKGTGAVWRRDAIEQAGGWTSRSLVEDQDLSFRAFEAGWLGRNLVSVSVAGEIPESFTALVCQRQRWNAGASQALRDLPWRLLRHVRWHQAIVFVLLQQFYIVVPICLLAIAVSVAADWQWNLGRTQLPVIAFLAAIAAVVVTKSIGAVLATRILGRAFDRQFMVDLVGMWILQLCLLPIVGVSLLAGFVSRRIPFVRTPKNSHEPRRGSDS